MIPNLRAWGRDGNYPGTPSEKFEMFYDVSVVTTYKDKEQHVITDFGMYNESEYSGTEIIDYTLMQSTGLFDKNGVEIFEGDIVIAWSQGVKGIFEIKRRIDGLWLLYPAWKDGRFWYLSPTEDGRESIEVIGNIYENPELIESVEE